MLLWTRPTPCMDTAGGGEGATACWGCGRLHGAPARQHGLRRRVHSGHAVLARLWGYPHLGELRSRSCVRVVQVCNDEQDTSHIRVTAPRECRFCRAWGGESWRLDSVTAMRHAVRQLIKAEGSTKIEGKRRVCSFSFLRGREDYAAHNSMNSTKRTRTCYFC